MMLDWMNRISFYKRIQLSFILLILLPFGIITYNSIQAACRERRPFLL
jgi:hypothetical protein